jgi:peptidyl-prolyl cis-trans isomerase SurA
MQNPANGNARFEDDQLNSIDPLLFAAVNELKPGDFTRPVASKDERGKSSFKIYLLKTRTQPHKANLKDDYQRLQDAAIATKKQKTAALWVKKHLKDIYVKVDEDYKNCLFKYDWIKKLN